MSDNELLFTRSDLSAVLQNQKHEAVRAIDAFDASRLVSTGVDDLMEHFLEEYKVEVIKILDDQTAVDQTEVKIDVSQDRSRFIDDRSQPIYLDGTRITFFVPYEGDRNLFYCRPSTFDYNPPRVVVGQAEIQFIYDRLNHNAEAVKSQFDSDLGKLKRYLSWVERDVNQFNQELTQKIRQRIEWRKDKVLKDRGLVSSLGFPLRKRAYASLTYVAPVSRKKIKALPPATTTPFAPEPALEMVEYDQILSIISNMVLVMERSPNAFRTMKEEDLRQHFLVQLNGQYEGQATGETFNNQGKTDILIRVNDKNIFIAECKFWKGEKAVSEAIDQLLGYTSWRDTKTALLVFNRSKNFSDVLGKLPEVIKAHPNFKRQLPYSAETGSRYVLHQIDDLNRELILTVLAFDIPANE